MCLGNRDDLELCVWDRDDLEICVGDRDDLETFIWNMDDIEICKGILRILNIWALMMVAPIWPPGSPAVRLTTALQGQLLVLLSASF